jgi:hypothetical protein
VKKTAFGIFAHWLTIQIPKYVDSRVDKVVGKIPKPKDGKSGVQGVSVVDAEIAVDDHLVLKLSDGKIIDAGELPSVDSSRVQQIISTSLQNQQIYVSATAPSNPSLNDLWLDIS